MLRARIRTLSCAVGLALLGAAPSAAAQGTAGEQRVALVVGNSAYPDAPLKNTLNDARGMAQVLKEFGFQVTEMENASQQKLEEGIREFRTRLSAGRGVGLFFFAGHGVALGGRNYLLPVGQTFQSESDVRYKATDAGFVLGAMEDAGARVSLVILDACRNNPFGSRSLFRSESRGLAVIEAPRGSLVAFATAPGSTAADGDRTHGLYTGELIKAIREMPNVEVEQLLKRVSARVQADSDGAQVPYRSSSLTGEFFFRAGGGSANPVPVGSTLGTPPAMTALVGGLQVGVNAEEAKIYVDGELKGSAAPSRSLDIRDLPVGSVRVRVEAPGHQAQEQTVEIRQGQWTQALLVLAKTEAPNEPRPVAGGFRLATVSIYSGTKGGQLAVDGPNKRVYIAGGMGQQGLVRINTSNLDFMTQTQLAFGGGIAVDQNTGRYATTDGYGGKLIVFNRDDSRYDQVPLSGCGGDLDADPATGRFFISTQCSDHLAVYSQSQRSLLANIALSGVGSRVVFDPGTGRIYENLTPNHGHSNLVAPLVVEGAGYRSSVPFTGFVHAVDEKRNRLYVTDESGALRVLDGITFATLHSFPGRVCSIVIADPPQGRFHAVLDNTLLASFDASTFEEVATFTLPVPMENMRMAPGDDRIYGIAGSKLYVLQR
jgi:uncharacterized caspase-like protein